MFKLEALKSELDLFQSVPIQTSVESGKWISYKPLSSLKSNSMVEFCVPGSGDEYIDLSLTYLYCKVKITDSKGGNIKDTDNIGPVNNFLHSLFDHNEVLLNGQLISPSASRYCLRAYYETLLNYSQEAKTSHLTTALWRKDTAGKMDSVTENEGYAWRKNFSNGSKEFEMLGGLHMDLFNINKFLLSGVEVRIRLGRTKAAFALMGDSSLNIHNFNLEITDATLLVRKLQLAPKILIAQEMTLSKSPALYPYVRTETKIHVLNPGILNTTVNNIYLGIMPVRVIIGMVSHQSCNGALDKNPYNFQHYNLNYLSLYVDSDQFPAKPLQPNFENDQYIEAFYSLFTGTNIHYSDNGNGLDLVEYKNGFSLFALDISPDLTASNTNHWSVNKQGQLRLELGFSKPLPETVSLIIFAEFQSLIQIDKNRHVLVDNGP